MKRTKQKIYKFTVSLMLLFFIFSFKSVFGGDYIKTVTDFMADGTWTAPTGVTNISIEGWGGGGAGAGNTADTVYGEGAGGGGAYAKINSFTVTPGSDYTADVGAGGVGSTGQNVDGSDTTFNSTTMVADGGLGGSNEGGGNGGGAGGTTGNSTGDVEYAGGSGGAGGGTNIGSGGGGGAGGAGGAGGVGGNGSSGVGGTAGAGGLGLEAIYNFLWNIGGEGTTGSTSGRNGNPGAYPGGGGAGAYVNNSTDRTGGSGTAGKIAITYVEPSSSGYPQFVSKSVFATSTATSATVPLPPGYLKGDLILFFIAGRPSGSAGSNDTITVPAGWTQRGSRQRLEVGILDAVSELWYKVATSTNDSNTVSVGTAFSGTEGWVMQTFAYRGVNQSSPFSATNVGGTNASSVTFTPTGATPAPLNSSNRSRVVTFVLSTDNNMLAFDSSRGFLTRAGSNEAVGSTIGSTAVAPAVSLYVADQATTTTSAATMPVFEQVINGADGWLYISEALEPAPPSKNLVTFGAKILKIIGGKLILNQQ